MNKLVFFDYGHGGTDPGATFNGRKESNDNLRVGMKTAKIMRDNGVSVDESRTTDKTLSLSQRSNMANRKNYAYLVSFHRNSSTGGTARGVEVFAHPNSNAKSKALATRMNNELVKLGFVNRGMKTANFHMLREVKAFAVLPELGFINNPSDNALFDKNIDRIAETIAKSILAEMGITYKESKPVTTNLYRVRKSWSDVKSQKGAYANLDSAISLAKELKLNVYDWNGKQVYPDPVIPSPKPPKVDSSRIAIVGKSVANYKQMEALLKKNNPNPKIKISIAEFCKLFIEEGEFENIRGDIAFCQAMKETGWLKYGGQVLPEQNNYCGLGATNNSPIGKGAWFDTERLGIRAQIQHLHAYATKGVLSKPLIDQRYNLVSRGVAPYWTDLNGKWAVPGKNYGEEILDIYTGLLNIKIEEDKNNTEEKGTLEKEIESLTLELKNYKDKINQILDIIK